MQTVDLFKNKYLIAYGTEGFEALIQIKKDDSKELAAWKIRSRINMHRNIKNVYLVSNYNHKELYQKVQNVNNLNDLIQIQLEDENNITIIKLGEKIEHR